MKKPQRTSIYFSESSNPWLNLAIEEYLINKVSKNEVIFYMWQNDNTVVIGRNQNPWKECNIEKFESDGGKLARRLSGGGAVFHDMGNLNFTFVMAKENYSFERQAQVIINALKELGIQSELSGRNDILTDGKKFSGNAFYHNDKTSMHHGTILVNADLLKISDYLNVSKEKLKSKGVKSVKSRVVNLTEINSSINTDVVKNALKFGFQKEYGLSRDITHFYEDTLNEQIVELYDKYSSEKWRYSKTPEFEYSFGKRFEWGEIELNLKVDNGIIKDIMVFSDSLEPDTIDLINEKLPGVEFDRNRLKKKFTKLSNKANGNIILKNLAEYMDEISF